jgi:hypothetical protein
LYISEEPNIIPYENNMFINNEARRNNINEYFSAKQGQISLPLISSKSEFSQEKSFLGDLKMFRNKFTPEGCSYFEEEKR